MSGGEQEVRRNSWLADPLSPEVERSLAGLSSQSDVRRLAVMPDVHLAHEVCVGVVLASRGTLYPGAVGGDIGCGMAAIGFDEQADLLNDEGRAARLLWALPGQVPAIRHSRDAAVMCLPGELHQTTLAGPSLERLKGRDGTLQFGSLGRGNHFLELQRDEQDRLWLMIHSGSRAMGPAIQRHHLGGAIRDAGLPHLEADSDAGQAYLADLGWAVRYAWLNRRRMVEVTVELMEQLFGVKADWGSLFQCHHNHLQRERHQGEELWVHRKGALEAAAGMAGMIPGSMGTPSFHVSGRGHEPALNSSSHGAGRRMSRTEARRTISRGKLLREAGGVFFDRRRARLLREEAPSAYRDIHKVMRAQRELTRIRRKLLPLLSYKGG